MVPKLVIDEKNDELRLFINPLLERSVKNNDLSLNDIEPIFTLKPNFPAGEKKYRIPEDPENFTEKWCHSEEKTFE